MFPHITELKKYLGDRGFEERQHPGFDARWKGFWWSKDMIAVFQQIERMGWGIGEDGKYREMNPRGYLDSPWIFVPSTAHVRMHCAIWKDIYFDMLKFLPVYCRCICHKVVVHFSGVADLVRWHSVMDTLIRQLERIHGRNFYGKLGVDRRDYTEALYSAFFYCRSLEEGKLMYEAVQRCVEEEGFSAQVLLKKGCTEMDRWKPSDQWGEPTEDELMQEGMLNDCFGFDWKHHEYPQREWLQNRIRCEWVRFAIERRDDSISQLFTWEEINQLQGKPVKYVEYQ